MERTNEMAVRCPVCGGPANDVQLFADTDTGITIRACRNTDCDAFHPAAMQDS